MWGFKVNEAEIFLGGGGSPLLSLSNLEVMLDGPLAVLGRNGAGKTTFLRLLAGIVGPCNSPVSWGGGNQPQIGYLPASFGLIPELSVQENLRACSEDLGENVDIHKAIEVMKLESLLQKSPGHLSIGEGQRVRFAIAISRCPDIYLLDEPVSNMDIDATMLAIEAMRDDARSGKGVVLVTHDLATVESLCPNLLILDGGRVVYQGARKDFTRDHGGENFAEAYRQFMGSIHAFNTN